MRLAAKAEHRMAATHNGCSDLPQLGHNALSSPPEYPSRSQASQSGLTRVPSGERIQQRLLRPHILTEIVKTGLAWSGKVQAGFIAVLETVSTSFRHLLRDADRIAGRAGKMAFLIYRLGPLCSGT
jgi:hypothetical protein